MGMSKFFDFFNKSQRRNKIFSLRYKLDRAIDKAADAAADYEYHKVRESEYLILLSGVHADVDWWRYAELKQKVETVRVRINEAMRSRLANDTLVTRIKQELINEQTSNSGPSFGGSSLDSPSDTGV